jgi:excisionase family DNA binding protein
MSVSKSEIEALEEWLRPRLGSLISHGDKVRELLKAANGSPEIIKSAIEMVIASEEAPPPTELTPQQLAMWNTLLPILAEHGLMAVKGGGPALPNDDKPMTKEEAAEYLGFSVSKLNRCIKKKQISYEKYGAGRTATVRFQQAELERFKKSRNVAARTGRPQP